MFVYTIFMIPIIVEVIISEQIIIQENMGNGQEVRDSQE